MQIWREAGLREVPLAAYSGGTVWDFHPLRVAAGANVKLSALAEGFGRLAGALNGACRIAEEFGKTTRPSIPKSARLPQALCFA
jgi:hypothetical protein